jgi:NAD(P)-dependent dehydrogenase (short-subunit alcohol dehydrogenase family)
MREGLLESRRVLVVGAGTQPSPDDEADAPVGNGRAIAVQCARGAAVVCADRDEGSARATAAMIEGEGGKSRVVVGDVRSEDAQAIVAGASPEGLDGGVWTVSCATSASGGVGLAGTSAEDWDTTFAVNLRSHFSSRAALPC